MVVWKRPSYQELAFLCQYPPLMLQSQRVSHVVLRRISPDGVTGCVVPLHRELAIGTLRGILSQANVTPEEFMSSL